MDFCVPNHIVGLKQHIVVRDKPVFTSSIPNDILVVGSKEFIELTKLYHLSVPKFPSKEFRAAYKHVVGSNKNIPWQYCLPQQEYKRQLKAYIKSIQQQLSIAKQHQQYTQFFLNTNQLFNHLYPAKINQQQYHKLKQEQAKPVLKTFQPHHSFVSAPLYTRTNSITGQISILKGPNILTLDRKYRNILTSQHKNGSIWYLDFKSLDPRIALILGNVLLNKQQEIPYDIYTHISNELGTGTERDAIKLAVISKLYGASNDTIKKQLKPYDTNPEELVEYVHDFFEIDFLQKHVMRMFKENNGECIYNHLGRPIYLHNQQVNPNVLVNYFVHSTTSDLALKGFWNIVEFLQQRQLFAYIKPIFILHDALLIDVKPEAEKFIQKLCAIGSKSLINRYNVPIEATKLEQ